MQEIYLIMTPLLKLGYRAVGFSRGVKDSGATGEEKV